MKIFEFENPISGGKGNLLNLGSMWGLILGVFVLFLVGAMGQNIAGAVSKKIPMLDTSINDPFVRQMNTSTGKQPLIF